MPRPARVKVTGFSPTRYTRRYSQIIIRISHNFQVFLLINMLQILIKHLHKMLNILPLALLLLQMEIVQIFVESPIFPHFVLRRLQNQASPVWVDTSKACSIECPGYYPGLCLLGFKPGSARVPLQICIDFVNQTDGSINMNSTQPKL